MIGNDFVDKWCAPRLLCLHPSRLQMDYTSTAERLWQNEDGDYFALVWRLQEEDEEDVGG